MQVKVSSAQVYVYLLRCADDSIYVGMTTSLEQCLVEHFNGEVAETREKLPVEIYSYIAFNSQYKADAFYQFLNSRAGRLFIKNRWI